MVLAYVVMINIGGVINAFMGLADTVYWKILDNATITNELCFPICVILLRNHFLTMNLPE